LQFAVSRAFGDTPLFRNFLQRRFFVYFLSAHNFGNAFFDGQWRGADVRFRGVRFSNEERDLALDLVTSRKRLEYRTRRTTKEFFIDFCDFTGDYNLPIGS
jgi:hypothetical protein